MSPIRRTLAASLLLGCASSSSSAPVADVDDAAPATAPASDEAPTDHPPEAAPPTPKPDPQPEPEPEPGGDHGVLHEDLNAPYAEETDVRRWKARFESREREVAKRRDDIVAQLHLKPGMAVADLGAGTGLFTFAFAEAVGRTGKVYAVDVQPYFLDHLRATAREKKLPQVQAVQATQRSPGLPEASIDVAFFCDAYHHIEHPAPYLAELRAALRPGGRLVVVDYDKSQDAKPFIRKHLRATPETFRAEIEAAGFRFEREWDGLEENFVFVFQRPG